MTENKRYTLRLHPKDNGVKIFNNHDEDNWRILNLHFNDYEDVKFVREQLEPVVDLLNSLSDENEQLKQKLKSINGLMAFDRPTDQTDKITCVWNKDLIKLDFGGIDD